MEADSLVPCSFLGSSVSARELVDEVVSYNLLRFCKAAALLSIQADKGL